MRNLLTRKLLQPKNGVFYYTRNFVTNGTHPRILITGGLGQLGLDLTTKLRKLYGKQNVILTDVAKQSTVLTKQDFEKQKEENTDGPYAYLDVSDLKSLHKIVVDNEVNCIIHYAALLSALGEKNVALATQVNVMGATNVLEVSRVHNLKVFIPSTIGAFGPDTPREQTPDLTIQRPRTIYGVSKVFAELMGEYYYAKYGTDFRSLRFPGIISANTYAGAGTTDYAAKSFHSCVKEGSFTCDLEPDTFLPMMYIDDCSKSVIDMLHAPDESLKHRTYNISSMSFSPAQLENEIQNTLPDAKFHYEVDQMRQNIANSWPQSLDDTNARRDWKWSPDYDLATMAKTMFEKIRGQTN